MGKVRKFFSKLKSSGADNGSRDNTASALPEAPRRHPNIAVPSCRAIGTDPNRDINSANDQSSGEVNLPAEAAENDLAKEIWINAYTKLQNDQGTCDLVKVYEEVLRQKWEEWEGENDLFANCADVSQKIPRMCLVTERTLQAASKHASTREGIAKAADFIGGLNAVVKPMLEANAVASMAWAGVCVVLPFFVKPVMASTEMANGLDYVRCRMEWYMALVKTLLDGSHANNSQVRGQLKHRIQELYVSILTYEMQCVRWYYHDNPIVRGFRAIVTLDDWKASLESLQTLESRVQRDMKFFASTETLDYLASIASSTKDIDSISRLLHEFVVNDMARDRQARQAAQSEITGQFKTTDYERQMKLNPQRVPGTCEWFCGHTIFRNWLEGDSRFLLASADPGCGKSTLARHIIENVLPAHDASTMLSYFFFKDTPEQKHLATGLSAIIHQLLYTDGSLALKLKDDINREGNDITALWKIFTKACIMSSRNIVCVFDALDECEEVDRNDLIEKLNSFVTDQYLQGQYRVKFLVTTRGYPQILDQFSFLSSDMIHLSGDGKAEKDQIQSEISLVLDFKLNELAARRGLTPEQTDSMRESFYLKGEEQRTYLWLKLVFEVLYRTFPKSAKDWQKPIVNPPDTVFKAYEVLLNQVSEDEGERESVRVLLHLIVAAHRPLTLREMNVAINVREYMGGPDESSMDLLSDSSFKDWLIDTCGFFVTVYDERVFLIHQTAKEFLMRSQSDPARQRKQVVPGRGQSNWNGSITSHDADACMAESCIAYLSLGQFNNESFHGRAKNYYEDYAFCENISEHLGGQPVEVDADKGPSLSQQRESIFGGCGFLTYTIAFWVKHFDYCQMFNEVLIDIGENFIPHYFQIFRPRRNRAPGWLFLTLMAFREQAGPSICEYNCKLASETERFFVENYTVGRAAFWFDHVRLLQHAFGQKDCDDAVFCFYHCRVLQAFVSHKQDDDDKSDRLPSWEKADESKEDIREWEHWQRTGYCEDKAHTPLLHTAARFGALNCAQYVLERGSDIDEQDSSGLTPLSVVALWWPKLRSWRKAKSLLDLLLDYGADTKKAPTSHESALFILLRLLDYEPEEGHLRHLDYDRSVWASDRYVDCDSVIRRIISAGVDPSTLVQAVQLSNCGEMYGRGNRRMFDQTSNKRVERLLSSSYDKHLRFHLENAVKLGLDMDAEISRLYNSSLVKVFLDHGADINSVYGQETALEARIQNLLDSEWVQLDVAILLYAGADMRIHMGTDRFALDIVLRRRDDHLAAILLNHDPVPQQINHPVDAATLETRLHRSSVHECEQGADTAELLLRFGAQLEAQDVHGQTALHHSIPPGWGVPPTWTTPCAHGTWVREMIQLLHSHGANINARDHKGNTPLHKACYQEFHPQPEQDEMVIYKQNENIVQLLVELGADCTATNEKGETPLHVACMHASTDTVSYLLENGKADVSARDCDGRAPLEIAIQARKYKCASLLIQHGSNLPTVLSMDDIEARDDSDFCSTFLHHLCYWNLADAAKLLLRHCADPNSRNAEGVTPFFAAVSEYTPSYTHLLELLLNAGADIESQADGFHTPLITACCRKNPDAVKFLPEHGASLTGHGEQPWTVLLWACKFSSPEIVEILLQHGAEMELRGSCEGKTLMHVLAKEWTKDEYHKEIIHVLRLRSERASSNGNVSQNFEAPWTESCQCSDCLRSEMGPCLNSYVEREEQVCAIVRVLLDADGWSMAREVDEGQTPFDLALQGRWMRLAGIFEEAIPACRRRILPLDLPRHSFHGTSSGQGLSEDLEEDSPITNVLQSRTHAIVMDLSKV